MIPGIPTISHAGLPAWVTPEELDRRTAHGDHFPLVDHDICVFAFRGEVVSVRLEHFGTGLPHDLHYRRLGHSDWWVLPLRMPAETRLEYKVETISSYGTRLGDDPLNPHGAEHPFGANSVCTASGYHQPGWSERRDGVERGRIVEYYDHSEALGRRATAGIYLPNGFELHRDHRYPLLVMLDGDDYVNYAGAQTVLDNLIADRQIPPMVVAFSRPGERLTEYADDPRHHRYLVDELVPALERDLPVGGTPALRCLMGCSFGGVATLSAAVYAPGYFGRLLLQSGSFAGAGEGCWERPERLWWPVKDFVARYLQHPTWVTERMVVTCGAFESLICENRGMLEVLRRTGMDVRMVIQLDGHNWVCWRDSLGLALPWLFPHAG
ncbi:MAG: alpha/beta hydrolase-fold protein [Ilumatobacteraceae bacterium]